ncbi:unnamed protein product [Toxocara canis]|uniref:Secreted protein n=1 Tax=Toxocara canis TaxID=6265 RepID=A0A183U798_TOXCA|nr:unnamed protein product [Toxocara canis]
MRAHTDTVTALSLSPNGTHLLSNAMDCSELFPPQLPAFQDQYVSAQIGTLYGSGRPTLTVEFVTVVAQVFGNRDLIADSDISSLTIF